MKAHLEETGRRRGWVQTPLGRRRRRFEPRYTSREALSEVLATAESDVFKLGLRRLWESPGQGLVLAAGTTAFLQVDSTVALDAARDALRLLANPIDHLHWVFDVGAAVGAPSADKNQTYEVSFA